MSQKQFERSTAANVTIQNASSVSLELTISAAHSTQFKMYGSGFGQCTVTAGTLLYNEWTGFIGGYTSAEGYIGRDTFRIWFTKEGTPVAFFEGKLSGRGTFTGEGKAQWQ